MEERFIDNNVVVNGTCVYISLNYLYHAHLFTVSQNMLPLEPSVRSITSTYDVK